MFVDIIFRTLQTLKFYHSRRFSAEGEKKKKAVDVNFLFPSAARSHRSFVSVSISF